MRELPPPDDINLERDSAPVIYVTPDTFHCVVCRVASGGDGASTTVDWLSGALDGPHGRCRECGSKFVLARPGESVPHWTEQGWT